ncbi:unnamed protein product [Pelagomonas calceolata]|uniref:RAP domain-containing protein n=1 Tax=Pelagomonas calceolata TaxID=35677 RepID=A0A8J2SNF6_9STRA|nr:unnamed protein product [Pelagomonas calceolata]
MAVAISSDRATGMIPTAAAAHLRGTTRARAASAGRATPLARLRGTTRARAASAGRAAPLATCIRAARPGRPLLTDMRAGRAGRRNLATGMLRRGDRRPREGADAIDEAAARSIGSFTGQGLANTLWAYCVLGVDAPAFFAAAAEALPSHIDALSKDFAASSQLYQVFLYLQIESPHQRLLPVLAEHRQIWLDAFWNDSIRPSQSQLGVSHALNVLGWDHEDELRTEDGLSLDMAQPSTKTAVEFDGPTHYLQGPDGPSVDGRTAFKRRLLGRLGWTCAAVPYFEWDPLLASGATEPYLRGVLARLRNE